MTIAEFNEKYRLNFSEDSYLRSLFNVSARGATISYTDSRMPTASDKSDGLAGKIVYAEQLQRYMHLFAKSRPLYNDDMSLDGLIADYESMFMEMSPGRTPYEGLPQSIFQRLKAEAIRLIPEDSVKLEENIIQNNARVRKASVTGYAKDRVADYLKKGNTADAVDTLKAMERIHASHGWKFGNIFKNIREVWAIRSMRSSLQKALGQERFDRAYAQEAEKFGYKEEERKALEGETVKQQSVAEQKVAREQESLTRENVHVAEAEEPVPETSRRTQEPRTVAPQKELK